MYIQGALKHVNGSVSTEEFLRFLAGEAPGGCYFMVQPPPGITMAAAIDWRVILQDAAAVSPFAFALWSCYESLMVPLHSDGATSAAGILVQIKNKKGGFDQFLIGMDITDRETLVHRMEESTRILFPKHTAGASRQEIKEMRKSGYWEEIK